MVRYVCVITTDEISAVAATSAVATDSFTRSRWKQSTRLSMLADDALAMTEPAPLPLDLYSPLKIAPLSALCMV